VAQEIVDLKKYDVRRDGMVIELDRGKEDAVVNAVPAQLRQVILNLVTNAQEAMRGAAGSRGIRLTVRAELDASVLEVHDRGPGIPPAAESRLFQPYYTTKPNGTGLGLAISAGIAREFGGTLTARNRPDGGAVFQLRLPRVGAPAATPIEPPPASGIVHASNDAKGPRETPE
jgi:two-component system C4-dicarboxylate transport sensor histidine kinase DctB